jgi:acetylornithine deacetylase/succinyl-diaminopimelate desuccinylase-like protein
MTDAARLQLESTELLRTLIRNACVNTGDRASGQEVRTADALEDYLAGSGLRCERYEAAPGRVSLLTRIEGRDPTAPTLLLMGHTDVVPVNVAGWQRDPFGAELEDGVIWGRGATDMLNITATMAVAIRHLATGGFRPRGTLIYLAAADEEAFGGYGVRHLMAEHPEALKTDYVITEGGGVPFPTRTGPRLALVVGEKGFNWRRLVVRGTPGHGSMPFGSDNALVTAAEIVRRIAAYRPKTTVLDVWRRYVAALGLEPALAADLVDPDRVLDAVSRLNIRGFAPLAHACTHTTFSPNIAHGGAKINVVPDRVEIDVDIRALPGVSARDVDAMLADAIGDLADRVEVEAPESDEGSISPSATPLAETLARVTAALMPGSHLVPRMMAGATDARHFRWKGVTAYGFALHSTRIPYGDYSTMYHGNNERIDVESLGLTARLWDAVCRDLLGE